MPGEVDCTSGCDALVENGALGEVRGGTSYDGDCDTVVGDRCLFVADRAREIRAYTDLVRVEITVIGGGRVDFVDAGVCPGACSHLVKRGTRVQLRALANPGVQFSTWSGVNCTTPDCSIAADQDLLVSATFEARFRLSVAIEGQGSVEFGAQSYSTSFEIDLPSSRVYLRAHPSASSVTASFDGITCERPRTVDECTFTLASDTSAAVRFSQFWRWVVPVPYAQVSDTLRRDGGALVLARVSLNQAEIAEVSSTGLGRTSRSATGFDTQNFLDLADGGLWFAGMLRYQQAPTAQQRVVWGTVDAGSSGQFRPDVAFLRFDLSSFAPDDVRVWDLAEAATTRSSFGPGPLLATGDGDWFSAASFGSPPDGGSGAVTGVMRVDSDFNGLAFEALPSTEPIDVARTSAGIVALGMGSSNISTQPRCATTENEVPMLTRLSLGMCDVSVLAPLLDGGDYRGTTTLLRGGVDPTWASVSQRTPLRTNDGHVHQHDANLNPRWLSTIKPILERDGESNLAPYGVVNWNTTVLAAFIGFADPGIVSGYQTETGLRIPCPPGASAWLLLTQHDRTSGEITWGACILGNASGGAELVLGTLRRSPALGYNQQAAPTLIDDGVLIAGSVSPGALPQTAAFGPMSLTFTSTSSYLLVVTPP